MTDIFDQSTPFDNRGSIASNVGADGMKFIYSCGSSHARMKLYVRDEGASSDTPVLHYERNKDGAFKADLAGMEYGVVFVPDPFDPDSFPGKLTLVD